MKLVSIIVPVYNGAKYVKNCVNYIKQQDYPNIEVIFVNDGSTDNTLSECKKVEKTDKRFRVIDKANGGTSSTRNVGIEAAKGEYIAFFDVDDEYDPKIISKLVDILEKDNTDMAICGYYFKIEGVKNEDTVFLETKNYENKTYYTFDNLKKDYVDLWDRDMLYNVWNKLYRASVIYEDNLRFRVGHVYTEDRVFNRLFLTKTQKISITDECLYFYIRERVGSTSEKYRDDYFEIRNKEYNELISHFQEMNLWNEKSREYVSREFIERTVGAIENVFHAKKTLSFLQKYNKIKTMIFNDDIAEAAKYSRCRSTKMKVFEWAIRYKRVFIAYMLGNTIYSIRTINPVLFHKLKSRR